MSFEGACVYTRREGCCASLWSFLPCQTTEDNFWLVSENELSRKRVHQTLPPPKKTSRKRCWKAWRINWKLMNNIWIYLAEDLLTNISSHSSTITKTMITWHESLLYFAVPPKSQILVCIFKHEEHIVGNIKRLHFSAY